MRRRSTLPSSPQSASSPDSLRLTTGSTQGMKLRMNPARKARDAALSRLETSRAGVKERGVRLSGKPCPDAAGAAASGAGATAWDAARGRPGWAGSGQTAAGMARAALRRAENTGHQGADSAGGRAAVSAALARGTLTSRVDGQQLVAEQENTLTRPVSVGAASMASVRGTKIGVRPS